MATLRVETVNNFVLTLTQDEMVALRRYLGKSSTSDMLAKCLNRKQSEMVSGVYHTLNNLTKYGEV